MVMTIIKIVITTAIMKVIIMIIMILKICNRRIKGI